MTNELEIETTFIPHLKTQFANGAVVLFTGAGFSLGAVNVAGARVPSVRQLIHSLWEICYRGEQFEEGTQLQDIYDTALQADPRATERLMRQSFSVIPKRCPDYYLETLTMPWARIYTLNVDDLTEKVLEEQRPIRPFKSVSATTAHIVDVQQDGSLSIVHLNGSLDDLPNNVTFARSQYALRVGMDPFYDLLRHDLATRPVVFIGSSLEESQLWQHLTMRGPPPQRGEAELRPRSYLVTPGLPRSKQALLSRHKVVWLKMDTEAFCSRILSRMGAEKTQGNKFLYQRFSFHSEVGPHVIRVGELPEGTSDPTEYLLGAEPDWTDATHNRIAERECFGEMFGLVNDIRSGRAGCKFLVITGTAGTGKTSAMMNAAMRLEAEGIPTGWIESSERFDVHGFREALKREEGLGALFINNADLNERRLSRMVREALEKTPRMIIVCECRSSKVDRIIDQVELAQIEPVEYTIPYLQDRDIDGILEVLNRENRLGLLKGMSQEQRRRIFQAEAGRQMLVAMYKATHGVDFKEKVVDELNDLNNVQKVLYGLISVGNAHRFYVSRDEIAIACGDDVVEWPRALDTLVRRKVIFTGPGETYKARHREIAQFIYEELNRRGEITDVIRGLIKIAGTKMTATADRGSRTGKMLGTFISHQLIKRTAGPTEGRQIYSEFESLLQWDYHYWLHRGALELETGNLGLAENFLRQSKSIEPNDIFVDNELAYLNLRKANRNPHAFDSEQLVTEAMHTLEDVARRRPDQKARAYHIMGTQGLEWVRNSRKTQVEKRQLLQKLRDHVNTTLDDGDEDQRELMLTLSSELQRELLLTAVSN